MRQIRYNILGKETRAEDLINAISSYLEDLDKRTGNIPDDKKLKKFKEVHGRFDKVSVER
ncbi:hypothetical protein [Methanocaldococcus fervens]|uniref:hypothetical protein n=1 Tax=Methanocaldococcus fervens TaxID=83171 RepID=UPI00064F2981|nr:hypothetical protein [Methanocaldococcus fervens]